MGRHRIVILSNAYASNGSKTKIHSSNMFFVKGKEGRFNGIVMNKLVENVEFMSIFRNGNEINTNCKVLYFDTDDGRELRVYTYDGEMRRFRYSPSEGEFMEIKEGVSYRAV